MNLVEAQPNWKSGEIHCVPDVGLTTVPAMRTMSAAGRKRIAAVQRARWAKVRAQQKKAA
jgi:hypothetical protein